MAPKTKDRYAAERRGHSSENLAAFWLRLKGYRILERRLKTRAGEVDLVAAAPFGPVCFIEVKARALARSAADSVTAAQQARIARAACLYLSARPHLSRRGARFDIIAIAPHAFPVHHRDAWQANF
ncbi:MAG TPA: YraN family protein [Rhizomicrobium sp.]|jgi:putative endonuclease|nr:YraN family protein [Rhizomicrobium sp.]